MRAACRFTLLKIPMRPRCRADHHGLGNSYSRCRLGILPMSIISMIFTGIVFLMWAFSMFRTLFTLRSKAITRTGKTMPGPVDTLHEIGIWIRDPAARSERRQLLIMTIMVIMLSSLAALSVSSGA
jgi:hypothetical protein